MSTHDIPDAQDNQDIHTQMPVAPLQHIASQIPTWLAQASAEQRQAYAAVALRSAAGQARMRALSARFEAADAFVEKRLTEALEKRYVDPIDLRKNELISLEFPLLNLQLETKRQVKVTRHSLLAAAMAGFTRAEADDNGFQIGSVILPLGEFKVLTNADTLYSYNRSLELPIQPCEFAQVCREADLGQAYRRHFSEIFEEDPAVTGDDDPGSLRRLIQDHLRNELELQAHRALLTGDIDAAAQQMLLQLANAGNARVSWDNKAVSVSSLRLLASWSQNGTPLRSVMLLRQAEVHTAPCIAYIPADPRQPLKRYASVQAFADDLRERLRDDTYRQFFRRFVALDQQAAFVQRLARTLNPSSIWYTSQPGEPDPQADIGVRLDAVHEGCVPWLYQELLGQVRSDAQALVVANAEVDRRVRQARIDTLLELGMDALQVVAVYVPVLGAVMVGAGALQFLDEIFVGVDDWNHGQTQEALAHVLSVAENLAVIGVTAGAGIGIHRSSFVEGMLPVLDGSGRTRLVDVNLESFASPVSVPSHLQANAAGQFEWAGEHYIQLDSRTYRQVLDERTGHWVITHPSAPADQRLALQHNGQGAWRLAHEDPRQWGAVQALRRLGPDLTGLDDLELEQLRQVTGYSEAELQRVHSDNLARPSLLQDSLEDFQALKRIGRQTPAEQPAAWRQWRDRVDEWQDETDATAPLRRAFPGLSASARRELWQQATLAERTQLSDQRRVPLRIAEHARTWLRERQLNLSLTGLLWPDAAVAQADRIKLKMGLAEDAGDDLFQRAASDRAATASAIGQRRSPGWWRPPVRSADGRAGYELSGRQLGMPTRITRRMRLLRQLYPQLDDQQLEGIQAELGIAVDRNLARRMTDYNNLRSTLLQWSGEAATALDAQGQRVAVDPQLRTRAMHIILAAWRREAPIAESLSGRGHGYVLDLSDLLVGDLPAMTCDFSHVYLLTFDGSRLERLPAGFLRRFPRLEDLELQGNHFSEIPAEVRFLPELDSLVLDNNRLQPSAAMFDALLVLDNLQALVLRGNPMQMPTRAMATLGRLTSLRTLCMDRVAVGQTAQLLTHLQDLPQLESLWLRENQFVATPHALESLGRLRSLEHLDLSDNPLGDDFDLRSLQDIAVLGLRNCGLTRWPEGLSALMNQRPVILRSVALDGNPLTEVPVLQGMPFFEFDSSIPQPLRISATHLDAESQARLVAVGVHAVDLAPLGADWLQGCPADLAQWIADLRAEPESEAFFQMLDRTDEVQDYRLDPVRGRLRVQALLRAMAEPGPGDDGQGLHALREQVYMIGSEVRDTCGDGIQLLLQRSETLVMAHLAGVADTTGTALLTLGRQLFRADLLDDAAVRIGNLRANRRDFLLALQAAQQDVVPPQLVPPPPRLYAQDVYDSAREPFAPDVAGIRLQLRVDLQQRLGLAPQPGSMRYFQPLPESLRDQVVLDVRAQDTDAGFADWLDGQPFWTDRLERRHQARFDALFREWNEGHLYLFEITSQEPQPGPVSANVRSVLTDVLGDRGWYRDGQMQVVALSGEEQDTARQALTAGMAQARTALRRELTLAAVGEGAVGR